MLGCDPRFDGVRTGVTCVGAINVETDQIESIRRAMNVDGD